VYPLQTAEPSDRSTQEWTGPTASALEPRGVAAGDVWLVPATHVPGDASAFTVRVSRVGAGDAKTTGATRGSLPRFPRPSVLMGPAAAQAGLVGLARSSTFAVTEPGAGTDRPTVTVSSEQVTHALLEQRHTRREQQSSAAAVGIGAGVKGDARISLGADRG
jgi:hypothetical protein